MNRSLQSNLRNDLVTIVTVSYNQGPYLKRCIDSVLEQNYTNLQYIVVDAGSRDGSQAIIETYGEKIESIIEPDKGPADGLNKGFNQARGKFLAFINADDYFLPGALIHVVEYFNTHHDCELLTCSGLIETEFSNKMRKINPEKLTIHGLLYNFQVMFQQGTFFRTELFKRVGGFNPNNKTCWDLELFLRMVVNGAKQGISNQEIAVFFVHNGSLTGSGRLNKQYYSDRKRLFDEYLKREWSKRDDFFELAYRALSKLKRLCEKILS